MQKVKLDGGPFSWFMNDTIASLKRAELWELPMEAYSNFIIDLPYSRNSIPRQLFCIHRTATLLILPFLPITLAPLTIFYDIFHVAVGLLQEFGSISGFL